MNYTYLCGWFNVALLTVSGKTSTCMAVLSRYVSVMPYPDTLWFSSLKPMKLTADYSKVLYWYLQPPQYIHQPQFNSRCCPMFDYRERFAGQGIMTPTTSFRSVSINSDLAALSHHLTTTWDFVTCCQKRLTSFKLCLSFVTVLLSSKSWGWFCPPLTCAVINLVACERQMFLLAHRCWETWRNVCRSQATNLAHAGVTYFTLHDKSVHGNAVIVWPCMVSIFFHQILWEFVAAWTGLRRKQRFPKLQ